MKYRQLGNSDLNVSEISLGSWLTYAGGLEEDKIKDCTEKALISLTRLIFMAAEPPKRPGVKYYLSTRVTRTF
jgi:hypothetical protein